MDSNVVESEKIESSAAWRWHLLHFALAAVLGAVATFFAPLEWRGYMFGGVLFVAFIFAVLASASAKEEGEPPPTAIKAISYLTLNTSRPTAVIRNHRALRLFFLCLTLLAGMAAGLFAVATT